MNILYVKKEVLRLVLYTLVHICTLIVHYIKNLAFGQVRLILHTIG
jgi:hypothetical protein